MKRKLERWKEPVYGSLCGLFALLAVGFTGGLTVGKTLLIGIPGMFGSILLAGLFAKLAGWMWDDE